MVDSQPDTAESRDRAEELVQARSHGSILSIDNAWDELNHRED